MNIKTITELIILCFAVILFIYEEIKSRKFDKKIDQACKRTDKVMEKLKHKHAL